MLLLLTLLACAPRSGPRGGPSPDDLVRLSTPQGELLIELDWERAPIASENFHRYVWDGFYDGDDGQGATLFHRVVKGFVIQGGGHTEDMALKPTRPPIPNELHNGVPNTRGTLAMACAADLDSANSQFFINLTDSKHLDSGNRGVSAVFGRVVEGMEVADAIAELPVDNRHAPLEPVPILDAEPVRRR